MAAYPIRILFVCTGNACRSQIAEGYARALSNGMLSAASAGLQAHGKNPLAIKVMQEDGVDISGQTSKALTQEHLEQADIVVTVCGHADEHCPIIDPTKLRCHWPFDDPAKFKGDATVVLDGFRTVRDQIKQKIQTFIQELSRDPDLNKITAKQAEDNINILA